MRKFTLLFVFLLLAGVQVLQAQRTITGKVISKDEPAGIPGAQVMIKGTQSGTITNLDGEYTINVSGAGAILLFRSSGMKTQEITVGSSNIVNVTLVSEAQDIAGVEIVSSGYGVSRKQGVGAAHQVNSDQLKQQTEASVINSLQGTTPGLQVSAASGSPGASTVVRLRGISSMGLSSSEPLYIIDGVPLTTGNFGSRSEVSTDPLATLNPEDIESIVTLKDASAVSIYGSRASNGVIVINTKKGQQGSSSLQFNAKVGASISPYIPRRWQMLSFDDYKSLYIDAYIAGNTKNGRVPTAEAAEKALIDKGLWAKGATGTDWYDEITRTGVIQDYSITSSGGTEKTNFFMSGGYYKEDGFVIGTGYERYNARLNVDHKAKDYLHLGLNLSAAYAEQQSIPGSLSYANPIWHARQSSPGQPVKNADGTWNFEAASTMPGYNSVAMRQDEHPDVYDQTQYKAILSPYIRVNILKNLHFMSKVGVDLTTVKEKEVWSQVVNSQAQDMEGYTRRSDFTRSNVIFTNTLNWITSVKEKHNFNVMVGQEAQRTFDYETGINATVFSHPFLTEISTSADQRAYSYTTWATLASYFGRVAYDFKDIYYLDLSLRRDGSSRIGKNNQWGNFYAIGGKYRISHESFMKPLSDKWLTNLSLRASYGTTGNQDIDWYGAREFYAQTAYYNEGTGSYPASPGNIDLVWETKKKFNIGFEATIFDRVSLEFDYYHEKTKDNLSYLPVSLTTGFSSRIDNVGEMSNAGVEFQTNVQVIRNTDPAKFRWSLGFNITANKNKILTLPGGETLEGNISIREEGKAWNTLWLIDFAGIDAQTGRQLFRKADGTLTTDVSEGQRVAIPFDPKFYGGFNSRMDYRGFDFTMSFFYNVGSKYFSNDVYYSEQSHSSTAYRNVDYYYFDNRWKNPGDDAKAPKFEYAVSDPTGASNEMRTTRYLMNGSYLRIKSIVLGYTLPSKMVRKATLSKVRIYASADNLFQLTSKDFRGFDPDAGLSGSQASAYPTPRNFTLGVSVNF